MDGVDEKLDFTIEHQQYDGMYYASCDAYQMMVGAGKSRDEALRDFIKSAYEDQNDPANGLVYSSEFIADMIDNKENDVKQGILNIPIDDYDVEIITSCDYESDSGEPVTKCVVTCRKFADVYGYGDNPSQAMTMLIKQLHQSGGIVGNKENDMTKELNYIEAFQAMERGEVVSCRRLNSSYKITDNVLQYRILGKDGWNDSEIGANRFRGATFTIHVEYPLSFGQACVEIENGGVVIDPLGYEFSDITAFSDGCAWDEKFKLISKGDA